MLIADDSLISEYIEESLEHLETIESDLLTMEEQGENSDSELVNKVFRAAHTIKGGAGYLGIHSVKELSHMVENVLSLVRNGEILPTSEVVNVLLVCFDELRTMIINVKESEQKDVSALIAQLSRVIASTEGGDRVSKCAPENLVPVATTVEPVEGGGTPRSHATDSKLRINVQLLDSLMNMAGEMVLGRNQLLQAIDSNDEDALRIAGHRMNVITSELQETIMLTRMQPVGVIFNRFTRVVRDMSSLLGKEAVLTITGSEVELDKSIIEGLSDPLTHLVRNAMDHGIESPEQRRSAGKNIVGNIQLKACHEAGQVLIEISDDGGGIDPEKVAATAIAKGLIRLKQASQMSEKEKRLLIMMPGFSTAEKVSDISGRGVGLDVVKTNIERLNGNIVIESEPGRNTIIRIKLPLTLAIISSLFVEAGGQLFAIPQSHVVEAVCIAAANVKKCIERVGDTDLLIHRGGIIPVIQLADALNIKNTYIDPQSAATFPDRRERLTDRRCENELSRQEDGPSAYLRESKEDRRYFADSDIKVIIVTTGKTKYGIVVHRIYDTEEIVVKSLGHHLKHIHEYAGATIMGNGKIALILDVSILADSCNIDSISMPPPGNELSEENSIDEAENRTLLTFFYGTGQQLAVPLKLVVRVERITRSGIEIVGGRRVLQHRGRIMPLVMVNDAACVEGLDLERDLIVIIFEFAGHEVGLAANTPIDSTEPDLEVDSETLRQPGITGSVLLKERTVMIVDIFEIITRRHPEWFAA